MRYTVQNRSRGEVYLPLPLGRFLPRGKSVTFSTPTSLFHQQDGVTRENKWQTLLDSGMISVEVESDNPPDAKIAGVVESTASEIAAEAVAAGGSASVRFLNGVTPQYIYVHPTAGSDSLGDGLSMGTAYQTIQRAVNDIPNKYNVDVIIQLPAGEFAGQDVVVGVTSAIKPSTTTSALLFILGDHTAAYTYASTGTGALVSGKVSQTAFSVNHGLTITDGSHWIMPSSGNPVGSSFRVLRASSTTQLVFVQSSTAARTNEKVCAYNTVFTTPMTVKSLNGATTISNVCLVGVKFSGGGEFVNVQSRSAHFINCELYNVIFNASGVLDGCTLIDYRGRHTTMFNTLSINGLTVHGPRGSVQQCVFVNTTGGPALSIGSSDSLPANPGSGIRLGSSLDFESTGTGLNITGSGSYFVMTNAPATFACARSLEAYHGALISAGASTSTWSGTVTSPAIIRTRSAFNKTGITYSVVNSSNAGQDFDVGAAATVVAYASNVTDPTDLAMLR